MLLIVLLFVAAVLVALGVAWLLRNEIGVKHVADEYAAGVSFDRKKLGA